MSKREKIPGAGKAKQAARRAAKEGLPKHYVFVMNDRHKKYKYSKLVNREKAADYVLGKMDQLGNRVHKLKDKYTLKEIA